MRVMFVVLSLVAGCSSSDHAAPPPPPAPAPPPAPPPAPAPKPPPPAVKPDLQCTFLGAMERIAITTDVATMTGTLERISAGKNHYRKIEVKLVADTPASFDLVFVKYDKEDYPPIRHWPHEGPPRERMTPGRSIVARLEVVDGITRILEREVDLHTGVQYQTRDHSYPCAVIDGAYLAAHPSEFLPR